MRVTQSDVICLLEIQQIIRVSIRRCKEGSPLTYVLNRVVVWSDL